MFRHCRIILRQPVINNYIVHLLSFFSINQQMHTIISQIITLLHVSTLSCHPQTACNQYLYRTSFIILYNEPTNAHNYFTNYHTATCFDTVVSSSDSLQSIPCPVTPVFHIQLSVIQFTIKMFHIGFMPVLILQSLKSQYNKIFKTLKLSYLQ